MALQYPYRDSAARGAKQRTSEAILQTLESYLSDGIQRDREDIAAIDRVLAETGKTITETFDPNCKNWPYEIPDLRTDKTHISHSTMTMMIRAIDLLRESKREGAARPAYAFDIGKPYRVTLDKARNEAFETLAARLKGDDTQPNTDEVRKITYSPSYGTNDPLTLSFLAEVLSATSGDTDDLSAHAKAVVKKLTEIDPVNGFADFFKNDTETKSKTVANAFVPLLAVRAAQSLKQETFEKRATYLRYFESTLHDQLSYSHIPDSRFDPAELIFSLEGVLRLSEQTIDVRLFDRILDVLEQAQSTSAHWRPSKPFLRTEKGFALFPISVEAANSLLWCCERPDRDEPFHSRSERYIALFRRFWNWLAARRVTVPVNKGSQSRVSGWHSDHVADPNSVQLWDTAQVVAFLLGYRRSLYNHIARTTLRLSRFDVRRPERAEQSWSSQTQDGQRARATVTAEAADDKVSLRADFEPVKQLGPYFETYRKVEQEFLIPWLEGIPRSYSMLLYGPPGTGKTSVAKNLANALGFSLITITVSDFLAGGGGEVEARAKMIFEVLEAQANVVILFDEIDELVLD
ncbi:MAG: AAA family ATPase, partial [Mesorhizobium sp.]